MSALEEGLVFRDEDGDRFDAETDTNEHGDDVLLVSVQPKSGGWHGVHLTPGEAQTLARAIFAEYPAEVEPAAAVVEASPAVPRGLDAEGLIRYGEAVIAFARAYRALDESRDAWEVRP